MDGTRDNEYHLILFKHHPIYTLGRGADKNFLNFLRAEDDGGSKGRARLIQKVRGERCTSQSFKNGKVGGGGEYVSGSGDENDNG